MCDVCSYATLTSYLYLYTVCMRLDMEEMYISQYIWI